MSAPPFPRRLAGQADAAALFAGLAHAPRELVGVAYLDPDWRLLALRIVAGRRDHVAVPVRSIVRDALRLDAARVIVAHNHPSGDAEPSAGDIAATRQLAQALRPVGVTLVDHLVLAAGEVVSLRVRGAL